MARCSIPSSPMLWQRHETLYVGLFYVALQKLSGNNFDTSNEDMISERLSLILHNLCYEESHRQQYEISPPYWENPIQPISESELQGGKKRKRPDFTCNLFNCFASCADKFRISFHVECKRLGVPSSSTWILNENYVTEGIKRFDCSSHEYGKRAISGMMVGYIVSMSTEEIQNEVNTYQKLYCPHNPRIVFPFDGKDVQQHHQKLKRKNVKPDNFKLIHLWVDLKS